MPKDVYESELDRCRPWIEAALEYCNGTHEFEDVCQSVAAGRMQLWPAERGCIVTEIVVYPRKKVLNVFLAGGELDQILDMYEAVKSWALSHACETATMTGRFGWKKPLLAEGWKPLYATYKKDLVNG